MGVRQVCCIVGVCWVEIRNQITRGFLLSGRRGLYSVDVDTIEEVTYKADFVTIHIFMKV